MPITTQIALLTVQTTRFNSFLKRFEQQAHLGALIAQGMNRWTDRETEEMVAHHAGVRVLCSLEYSRETIDHTSIEVFRNQLTDKGVEAINQKRNMSMILGHFLFEFSVYLPGSQGALLVC